MFVELALMVALMQGGNGAKAPDVVSISETDSKDFKEAAQGLDRNALLVRTLTAEIGLAQRQLKDLQEQVDKDRVRVTEMLQGLAVKAGIPKDKLAEYDLAADGGGFKLTRKANVSKN